MIYTIENDLLSIKVSDIGATLISLIHKPTKRDIILGFDDERGYFKYSNAYIGATVARNANRIKEGKFKINGIEYELSKNDGDNNLHSGVGCFSFRGYDVKEIHQDSITFKIFDKDMAGGFPGNLDLEITYKLEADNLLFIYKGKSDKDSILNVTNHAYFNLNGGKDNIYNQQLKINTNKMSYNGTDLIALKEASDISNTGFDFVKFKKIKDNFDLNEDNFSGDGIDHNYIFDNLDDKEVACLKDDLLSLTIYSDLPCLHIYTGNFINEIQGKNNMIYHKHYAICFECDYHPNAINYDDVIKPIIKANQEVTHYIKYKINEV